MPKNIARTCIIVADGARARFFELRPSVEPRHRCHLAQVASLENRDFRARGAEHQGHTRIEHMTNREAGAVHPFDARRQRHRLEIERRFAAEIAQRAAEVTAAWSAGVIVLIADPRLLGLARDTMRSALKPEIRMKELAKDYSTLTVPELERHLIVNKLLQLDPFPC